MTTSPYADLRPWLSNGLLGSGPRILSQSSANAAVGAVDNALIRQSTWNGTTLTTTGDFRQLLLVQTTRGDNNLDGQATEADYANIVANMGRPGASYFLGDLTYDAMVNSEDFAVVTAALSAGAAAAPQLLVPTPEPSPEPPPPVVATQPTSTTPSTSFKPRVPAPSLKPLPSRPIVSLTTFSTAKIARAPIPAVRRLAPDDKDPLGRPRPRL
jgi:hypothetical protein